MEQYYKLMNEYSGTELFKETIHFMNMSFPEWKTNRGIGFSAAEFILHCMEFLNQCTMDKKDEDFNLESLKTIYLSVAEDYQRFKTEYQFLFSSFALEKFTAEYENEIEDEYLTDFRYNNLFDTFLNQEIEKMTYDFK
ncbi:hypothetical protein B0A81_08815 [Flavobacterium plurextorum]|uniref:Uncharacterized protein n=1 Tax=Flavobacterium plurextorum TaxID=1114867 RepID=A0ABX4CW24_9FLAO|nr:hypothetical protein [Flavobacterium plurextorum]OXB08408.1 hypothetical protein B0A81_08815 [Flavobacterium plurextorum]